MCRGMKIGFVTDVEGNLDYFEKYIALSGVLRGKCCEGGLELVDDAYFVYGGDAVDKGAGDIRLCRLLAELKDRYPERVFLLVGNRDLNKLRMTAELSERDLARSAESIPKPHWDPAVPSYAQYLKGAASKQSRCRWLLEHTLGCPKTFELRRMELRALGLEASDEAVASSFVTEVLPGGALRAYLDRAVVAVRLHHTLFVHGSVDRLSAGFVPPLNTKFQVGTSDDPAYPPDRAWYAEMSLDEWIDGLNLLLSAGLEEHARRPEWDDDRCATRGGEALMAMQNRCAVWGRSVISNCWADGGNVDSPKAAATRAVAWSRTAHDAHAMRFEASTGYTSDALDADVAGWLSRNGVVRVVSGHRPVGDSPAILSSRYHGVELVCADTSYSDTRASDNRGQATASLVVEQSTIASSRLSLKGILADGRTYYAEMPTLTLDHPPADDGDSLLGTRTLDGWWYKVCLVVPLTILFVIAFDVVVHLSAGRPRRRSRISAKSWRGPPR